jgi:hypothetical protein
VDAAVEVGLGPGHEAVVELWQLQDAGGLGLQQEALADDAVQPLLLAAPLGRVGPGVDEVDAKQGAGAMEGGLGEGVAVVHVDLLGQTPADDGRTQHLLARAGVPLTAPAGVDQQPAVVADIAQLSRTYGRSATRTRYL